MNQQGPFNRRDLDDLGEFYASTHAVIAMREVLAGNRNPKVVAVRHDVDNHPRALDTAVELARWEAENGWRSTYFLLHTAAYFTSGEWREPAETIALLGHEIGLHADAIGYALEHGGDPHVMVMAALYEMREAGHTVTGVVGHGNQIAYKVEFANDEQFTECARPNMGEPDREITFKGRTVKLDPRPLAEYGLTYESIGLRQYQAPDGQMKTRAGQLYNTDSGGRWYYPFEDTIAEYEALKDGQLHLLVHPDHWHRAFVPQAVAA